MEIIIENNYYYKKVFRLLNGNEIVGCELDKEDECSKAFNIIRSELPQNIICNDNLAL